MHGHHAFVFDEARYRAELAPQLLRALEEEDDPDDPVEARAVRALQALADPTDIGLGASWRAIRAALADLYPEGRVFVTGAAVGQLESVFTQSAAYVAGSVRILEQLLAENRRHETTILPVLTMLKRAADADHGLLLRVD